MVEINYIQNVWLFNEETLKALLLFKNVFLKTYQSMKEISTYSNNQVSNQGIFIKNITFKYFGT